MSWRSAQTGSEEAWSPSRGRGMLLLISSVVTIVQTFVDYLYRSNIGGIIVAVMMQQLNQKHPDNYLLAMRILWAPIGLMIICWAIVPESPWFYARHGNKEMALKHMRYLYGGVEGYDFEEEYGIIEATIAHEKAMLQDQPRYIDVFKGPNLVCTHASVNTT